MQKWWKRLLWRGKDQKKNVQQLKLEKIEKQKELQLKQNTYAKRDDYRLQITFVVVGCDIYIKDLHLEEMHSKISYLSYRGWYGSSKRVYHLMRYLKPFNFQALSAICCIKMITEWCFTSHKTVSFFIKERSVWFDVPCHFYFTFNVNFLVTLLKVYPIFWCNFKSNVHNREYLMHGWREIKMSGANLYENLNMIRCLAIGITPYTWVLVLKDTGQTFIHLTIKALKPTSDSVTLLCAITENFFYTHVRLGPVKACWHFFYNFEKHVLTLFWALLRNATQS